MKKINLLLLLFLSGCGYSARDSQFTGQIKYLENVTPLICPNRIDAGISLGVIQNGSGSVSSHDIEVTVHSDTLAKEMKKMSSLGKVVTLIYNERRLTFCEYSLEVIGIKK